MKKKRTLIAKLPKAKDGGQKDKWGRSANDVWYGFNPDKKEFSTKDQWGRAPGSEWYGFDPKLKTWTKGNKAYDAVKKENENVRDYYNQYMNSARYKSMLGFNPDIDQKRKENLGYTPKTLSINTTDDLYPKFPEAYKLNFSTKAPTVSVLPSQPKGKPNTGGWSWSETGNIEVLPQGLGVRGLLPHEWSHSIDRPKVTNSRRLIPQKDIDYIKKVTVNDDNILKLPKLKEYSNYTLDELKENYPKWLKSQIDWKNYVGNPTEVRARLNDIRYQSKKKGVYDPFTQEVTPEIYKKLENTKFEEGTKEGFDALKQLKDIYTDEQIMYMLNNISENAPSENDNVNYIDELPVAKYGGVTDPPPKDVLEYKYFRMNKLIDLTLTEDEAKKKYMDVNPKLYDAYLYFKNEGYSPGTSCKKGQCAFDEDSFKNYIKTPEDYDSTDYIERGLQRQKQNELTSVEDNKATPTIPTYTELPVKFDEIITEENKDENFTYDNTSNVKQTNYPYRYHRERNPWTQTFEVMSPDQHRLLEREAYKLKNQGIKLTSDNMPVIENRELIDVTSMKPVGVRPWNAGIGFRWTENDILQNNEPINSEPTSEKTNEYKKGGMTKKRTVLTRLPKAQEGMPVPAPGSNPEEQGMAPQGQGVPPQEAQMQQQAPSPQAMDQQMQALLQEVASMLEQGADPMTIIGGLLQSGLVPEMVMQVIMQTGMAQDEQTASQMIQETMAQMQQGGGQQQPQAEGQPAPEQMQGQPMMALGGETALNDNIIEFAQLTGQSEKDIEDMVTAMIQEGTDAQTISDKLEEAITQIQQQQTQPQGMGQGMPQAAPGESQIQPPIIDGQTPAMRYGGPTPVDFQEIGQQIIKQYRKGGSSMGELDTSNTEAYVQNLKGAISNWVSTNNKIGLIKKRTESNLQLFDELPESVAMLPRAKKGIEIDKITDEVDKKYYTELKDKFKDYETADWDKLNQAYNEGKMTAAEFTGLTDLYGIDKPESENKNTKTETKTETNTNSAVPNQGESYDSFAIRTGKQSQPGSYTNMIWNGTQWVNTGANTNNPQYYYPGQYSDYGRSMSGQRYRPTNRFISSVTDMAQELGRGNVNPFIQGIGALAGSSAEEVMKKVRERLSDPDNKSYIIQDIQRRGILGREKKGKRNVVGQRILWNPTTGKAETVTTDNVSDPKDATAENKPNLATDPNNIAALDKQMRGLLNSSDPKERETAEEYFKDKGRNPEMQKDPQFDGKEYNEYLDNNKKLEEQAIKNLGPNATKEAIYDEMDRLEEQGLDSEYERPANVVTPLDSKNVGNVNSAYSILDPVTNETTLSGSPTMTNPDYFKPGNSAWFGKSFTSDEYFDPERRKVNEDDSQFFYEDRVTSSDPAYLDYIKANPGAYDIKNRPDLKFLGEDEEGMRTYINSQAGNYEKFNPSGSTGYDPERGFYAQGGELNEKIIWDFKNKKFNKAPILVAKNGLYTPKIFSNPLNMFAEDSNLANNAENYSQSQGYEEGAEMVQQKSGLNWDKIANSIYGAGSFINEKKRLLNSATSKYEAADARAGMFNPITPRSGNEGLYTQFGDFIPDRTGAKVLPGTGSDQSANTEGAANNIFEDINPGGVNLFSRNGGVLKFAQDGIEIDQEYDLTEDDLNELMPYLQQLGLTIQMI